MMTFFTFCYFFVCFAPQNGHSLLVFGISEPQYAQVFTAEIDDELEVEFESGVEKCDISSSSINLAAPSKSPICIFLSMISSFIRRFLPLFAKSWNFHCAG